MPTSRVALLKRWHAQLSAVEPVLECLGQLCFGLVAMTAMRRVAADNWATAGPLRRGWLGFAVAVTVMMVIGAVLFVVMALPALLLGF